MYTVIKFEYFEGDGTEDRVFDLYEDAREYINQQNLIDVMSMYIIKENN